MNTINSQFKRNTIKSLRPGVVKNPLNVELKKVKEELYCLCLRIILSFCCSVKAWTLSLGFMIFHGHCNFELLHVFCEKAWLCLWVSRYFMIGVSDLGWVGIPEHTKSQVLS